MNEAAGDRLELAIVGDDVEVNELVVAGGAARRHLKDEGDGSADDETAAHAADETVQVFFYKAGRSDVLDQAPGLKDHYLSGKRLPVSATVFIVGANVVYTGRQRGILGRRWGLRRVGSRRLGGIGCRGGRFGDDGVDDLVADAGLLERDESVWRSVLGAGVGINGGDDGVVGEAGFDHLDDGVVVKRLLGGEE